MKNLKKLFQPILLVLFIITFALSIIFAITKKNFFDKYDWNQEQFNGKEAYNPALGRLNSIEKISEYCDSLYKMNYPNADSKDFQKNFTELVDGVIRERFYHGYSFYRVPQNYLLVLFSKLTDSSYSSSVIPEDISTYPLGACSQVSMVMMDVLKKHGITTRKVGFAGKTDGHFAFETFYDGGWHFFDTDLEPDKKLLIQLGRPPIATIAKDTSLLLQLYNNHPKALILDVLPNYSYGEPNKFPAPKGYLFQMVTKWLSWTIWIFFGIAYLIVRRWNRKQKN